MTYREVLQILGLEIESMKDLDDFKNVIDSTFLEKYKSFYLKSQEELNKLNSKLKDNNDSTFNNTIDFTKNYSTLKDNYNKEVNKIYVVNEIKNSEIRNELSEETKNYNTNKDLQSERLIVLDKQINYAIDECKYNTTSKNKLLDSNTIPSLDNYNSYILKFNDLGDSTYNEQHSKLSKSSYSIKYNANKEQETLKEENKEILKKINELKVIIDDTKIELNRQVIELETELNNKIRNLDINNRKLKEQNDLQSKLQQDAIRKTIKEIEDKYQDQIKSINKKASERLSKIDSEYSNKIKLLEQNLLEKNYYLETKIKKNKADYEELLNKYKTDLSTLSLSEKHIRRIELKRLNKNNKLDEKLDRLEILRLTQDKLKAQARNKQERNLIDLRRNYKINLQNLNENKEKYPYLKELAYIENEKRSYERSLDNQLSIITNQEKAQTDTLKLYKTTNFDSYSTRQQININKYSEQSYEVLQKLDLSKKIEELKLNTNNYLDDLSYQFIQSKSLLSIEKNKHLNNLNLETIDYNKELNILYLDYFIKNKNLEYSKETDLNKELNRYNDESINYFRSMKQLEISNNDLDVKNQTALYESKNKYDIANESYKLQILKKNDLLSSINEETSTFSSILSHYSKTLSEHCVKVIKYSANDESKISKFTSYIKLIGSSLNKLVDIYSERINKYINTYIKYNTQSKYKQLEDNVTFTYNQKIEAIENEINQYKATIKSLQVTSSRFYASINELNLTNRQLSHEITNVKENKKTISINESKISDYRNKIKINNENIETNIQLNNRAKVRLNNLKLELDDKLNKVKKLEEKDSIVSINIKKKINKVLNNYKHFSSSILTMNKYHKLSNTTSKNKLLSFEKTINTHIFKFISSLKAIYVEYVSRLDATLINIKLNNEKSYDSDTIQVHNKIKKDKIDYEKDKDKINLSIVDSKNTHSLNIDRINDYYLVEQNKLKATYENNKNKIINKLNERINYYYNLFKSCDDLILIQNNNYSNSINQSELNQSLNIKEYNKTLNINIKNANIKLNENNSKLEHEINIIPKYTKDQEKILTENYKEQNLELKNNNDLINKELESLKKQSKKEIDIYNKEIKQSIKAENTKYSKTKVSIRKECLNSLKTITKSNLKNLKDGTN